MPERFEIELGVSDFVAVANQTLEYAYPSVAIVGELANFRISKNKWVYFDLKDEYASLKFFGTVYQLKMPLEDGMLLRVRCAPRLHPQFGFSMTVASIELVGEGTLRRAATLLEQKLEKEGLFDPVRKRTLPYPPQRIGLIASGESAAYIDFMKIITARWAGLEIVHADVQVQGADAPEQVAAAITEFNQQERLVDVVVVTRGGGSAEDLQAFDTEQVVRAIAGSRIPTLVAIGHERDSSLAERAADVRASTPSNAAELLTPDKHEAILALARQAAAMVHALQTQHDHKYAAMKHTNELLHSLITKQFTVANERLMLQRSVLEAYNPRAALQRGYAIVRAGSAVVRSGRAVAAGQRIAIELSDATVAARIETVQTKEKL